MLFSPSLCARAHARFITVLSHLKETAKEDFLRAARSLSKDEKAAFEYLTANSPISDLGYGPALFVSAARHGVFLRSKTKLPEKIFLPFVLQLRVNDEELSDCRPFFYRLLSDRIEGKSERESALEINRFLAENVTYSSTDERTRSALKIFASGFGRCGEESVFAVNALRACGIPARQIYCPRWSHCDDNHAWVEVYVDQKWQYLGACEIDSDLNRGWFTGAASRALFLQARIFGEPIKSAAFQEGAVGYLNRTRAYAKTRRFFLSLFDENGPVEGADVRIEVLNEAEFFPVLRGKTDFNGKASFELGKGSFCLFIKKKDRTLEQIVGPKENKLELFFEHKTLEEEFTLYAPAESRQNAPLSEEEEARLQKEIERAAALRNKKEDKTPRLIREAAGEAFYEKLKSTLPEKDLLDLSLEVLEEIRPSYRSEDRFYLSYVACPRVHFEPLFPIRSKILRLFGKEERERFLADPREIETYLKAHFKSAEALDDSRLETPFGALYSGIANEKTRDVLFVSFCRALEIPSRLSEDGSPEYWKDGKFCSLRGEKSAFVTLKGCDEYSLSHLREDGYHALLKKKELSLEAGNYRVLTQNRLPNGNIRAKSEYFSIQNGERREIVLKKASAEIAEMALNLFLSNFECKDEVGNPHCFFELGKEGGVFIWPKAGREPSVHLFNELKELPYFKTVPVCFLLPSKNDLSDRKLLETLEFLPNAKVYFHIPSEALYRRLYLEPNQYPLLLVAKGERAIYACGGYRVGSAKLAADFMELTKKRGTYENHLHGKL